STRRQKAWHGATGAHHRKGTVPSAVRQDPAGVGGAPGKTKSTSAEIASRIERGISGESTVCRGVCKGHGPAYSCADAALRLFAIFFATRLVEKLARVLSNRLESPFAILLPA